MPQVKDGLTAIYHPKQDHPWRQYKNRTKPSNGETSEFPDLSLKEFLVNIVENWETYKIPSNDFEDREYRSLARINQDKQAEWLIGFLKKHWLSSVEER